MVGTAGCGRVHAGDAGPWRTATAGAGGEGQADDKQGQRTGVAGAQADPDVYLWTGLCRR